MVNKDFTFYTYEVLLESLHSNGYRFQTLHDFKVSPDEKSAIIRHDIDLKKDKSLIFAEIENARNIKGTYYFRMVNYIYDENLITKIIELGHEIGYHYEDLSFANGDFKKAIASFENHLVKLRKLYPISTATMHGKSISRHNNLDLWDYYDYQDFGIISEPYMDFDFNKILYLTDSAQRWNGSNIAVRDKVQSNFNFSFDTTFDIIDNVKKLPNQILMTFHPDRWTNNPIEWMTINTTVKLKNIIKKYLLKNRR